MWLGMGAVNGNFEGVDSVYKVPEKLDEEAKIKPPYNSTLNYDAKVWRFVLDKAKKGAIVWNVA